MNKFTAIFLGIFFLFEQGLLSKEYCITDFGADSKGQTISTSAIQQAINTCSGAGGGTVIVPPGTFVTGPVMIKSNVTFLLQRMAVLKADTCRASYPKEPFVIGINNAEHVTLTGEGTIDGSGRAFLGQEESTRPILLLVKDSKNIHVENISICNSARWTFRLLGSEQVMIKGISIFSHTNLNNDGIDIDSRDVTISDCIIDCDDDALCFKSDRKTVCENVVVTNCILASNCNFIKMGTASLGGFKNIAVSNCVLRRATESNFRFWDKSIKGVTDPISGISGIALEVVDGGFMDQITINNISMEGVQTPVFMRLGSRRNPTGYMRNILISNIVATSHSLIPNIISAVPGFYIRNVILRDFIMQFKGTCSNNDLKTVVPEMEKSYPENRMFGDVLPSYGFYIRHARNITMENIRLILLQSDTRPALWIEDSNEIDIRNFKADSKSGKMMIKKESQKIHFNR